MSGVCYYKIPKKDDTECETIRHPRPQCGQTIEGCKIDIDYYHWTCDKYWAMSNEELDKMGPQELELAIMQLNLCIMLREKHQKTCVHPRCRDRGHKGAIEKLRKKLERAKEQKRVIGMAETIPFPELPVKPINYKRFLESVATAIGTKITYETKVSEGKRWVMVGITIPSGSILMEVDTVTKMAYQKLADSLIDNFASTSYRSAYYA